MEKQWVRTGIIGDKFLCIATFLPVRSWRHVVPFIRLSMRIEGQLKQSPGIVRYGLKTNLPKKHFWTLSVWSERMAVRDFVEMEPHQIAVQKFEQWAGPGAAFVEWESSESNVPWAEAMERLKNPTFYYRPAGAGQ